MKRAWVYIQYRSWIHIIGCLSILFCIILLNGSCKENSPVESLVTQLYDLYKERSNFDEFLSYYADTIVLEDIIHGDRIIGKDALKDFFNWDDENYVNENPEVLVVTDMVYNDHTAYISGYFTTFRWADTSFGPMHFTTKLIFNQKLKISKQIDWINYPSSLVDYENRKSSNDWIQ